MTYSGQDALVEIWAGAQCYELICRNSLILSDILRGSAASKTQIEVMRSGTEPTTKTGWISWYISHFEQWTQELNMLTFKESGIYQAIRISCFLLVVGRNGTLEEESLTNWRIDQLQDFSFCGSIDLCTSRSLIKNKRQKNLPKP